MRDGKVLAFPAVARSVEIPRPGVNSGYEPTLFASAPEGKGKIVFVDVEWLAEETLLTAIARNGVTAILDVRPRPIFPRPKFRHKNVVLYFFQRKVRYLEYAMLPRATRSGFEQRALPCKEAADTLIVEVLSRGLTMCLYDEQARKMGWLDDIRHLVRRAAGYTAELHPRSLSGFQYSHSSPKAGFETREEA
ncbi:hypothetical protein [Enterovirga aerilata]|uniref:Uncharacterized protein n=1 Tax=Enterovirga aerilata TaxID=2730920 RepID=A0A849IE51_9HYPH|nr:hypothetical protein [Enterovirga sp. DB1703]NNM74247.1 hypothetical protein [Enterovirga sp. DB1703]